MSDEEARKMECPNCHSSIELVWVACPKCGYVLRNVGPGSTPYPPRPLKDKGTAKILEILPALFGFFGIGHIYAGDPNGVAWLVGGLVFFFFAVFVSLASFGLGCFITIPVQLVLIAVSVSGLNAYMQQKPELFGA